MRSTLPSLLRLPGHLLVTKRSQTSLICSLFDAPSLNSLPVSNMLVSLTVGKVDAGVAVLLTQDNRLVSSISIPTHLQQAIDARACTILPQNNPLFFQSSPDTQLTRPRSNFPPSFSPATSRPVVSSTSPSRATTQPNPPVPPTSSRSKNASSIPTASRPPHPRFSVSATQLKLPSSWNGNLLT